MLVVESPNCGLWHETDIEHPCRVGLPIAALPSFGFEWRLTGALETRIRGARYARF